MGWAAFQKMTDTAVLLRRSSRESGERQMQRSMAGSVDYSIKPQFDPSYSLQILLHPLLHKQTQSPQCVCEVQWESKRGRRESFRILQGPTKVALLLHLLYIISQTSSNKERWRHGERAMQPRERKRRKSVFQPGRGLLPGTTAAWTLQFFSGVKWLQAAFLFHYMK